MKTKIDHEEALRLYQQGMNDTDIGKHFGVTQGGVTRWRWRHGLQPNNPRPSGSSRLTSAQKRQARKLLRDGATLGQVARSVGCSRNTAASIRKELGGDPRLRGHGITLQAPQSAARRDAIAIMDELKAATRRVSDSSIRDDTMGEMFLALMEGRLQREQIKDEARRYSGRQVSLWQSPWAPASIDEAMTEDGLRLVDLIACPNAQAWLDSVGA